MNLVSLKLFLQKYLLKWFHPLEQTSREGLRLGVYCPHDRDETGRLVYESCRLWKSNKNCTGKRGCGCWFWRTMVYGVFFTIAVLTQHFSRWIIWAWDGAEIFWPSKEPPIVLEIPLLAWVDGKTSVFIMFGKVHTLTNLFRWDGYLYVPCETLFFIIIFYLDKQPSGFNPTVWLCLVILSHLWAKQPNVIFSEEQRKSYEPVMQPKGVPRLLIETLVCFQHWLPVFSMIMNLFTAFTLLVTCSSEL